MLNYQVMSEKEAMEERFCLLKEGIYDAVITESQDKVSQSGNPMMDITLAVYDDNGKTTNVRDFLVFTPKMMWKVINFSKSSGLMEGYISGKLCSEMVINQRVKVKISVESGGLIPEDKLKDKPLGAKYPDKNKVEDYLERDLSAEKVEKFKSELIDDDVDVPF